MNADPEALPGWKEYVNLRACELFKYRCPVRWETLNQTDNPKVRFCGKCREEVHLCHSESELSQHAEMGHCAAFAVRIPLREDHGPAENRWPVLAGTPRLGPHCVLCHGQAGDYGHTMAAECGVFEDRWSPDIMHFDQLDLENEAFQAFSQGSVHAKCLLNWKYRDRFMEAWNGALQARFIHKRLVISASGKLRYTNPLTWMRTDAEIERQARLKAERQAEQEASAKLQAQRDVEREWARARLAERCNGARRKAIAMGMATDENVDRILRAMPKADFHRNFDEFDVFPFFF